MLPPSSTGMNMDATKKLFFFSKPFNPSFFKEFWEKYDAQGFSIWSCEYKDNVENRVHLNTLNLMGGFIQRAEDCRKYAFGCINMCAKDEDTPPFKLYGAWLFRGVEIPKEMNECPDAESYTFSRLDTTKASDRKKFEDSMTANNLGDDQVLERRYFK